MASGTGTRPLPERADERELLLLGELRSLTVEIAANTTKTFTFSNLPKGGLLVLTAGDVSKRGLYIYGMTTTGNVSLTTIHDKTQANLNISLSGRSITIANPTLALFVCFIATEGNLPTAT